MQKSPVVSIAKKVCPAVITIIASRDLPQIEEYYFLPVKGEKVAFPKKITDAKEKTKIGGGSGFIISKDGYILTCNHVVDDGDADFTAMLDADHKYPARVVAKDPLTDVAILKIEGDNFPFLKMGNSDNIDLGEQVLAIGNPLGEFEDTLSLGIVSGLSRKITAYNNDLRATNLRGLIQTDAAINPGNSGGPLVDMKGNAIGINTAMIIGAENIGFAIPINYIKEDLAEVKRNGFVKRPFLGIKYVLLNEEIARVNKLDCIYGALIVREMFGESPIAKGSSAEEAGLKEYDIVLELNKEQITQENSLNDILSKCEVGDKVELLVRRNGKVKKITTMLKEKK
ncbi:MAG: trypsin-like peptidase domain-containing protein [Candidatus Pacebacteria bacterium]|nr:trypsin-like peptidase domain-containing protein [Candidatus Paceibacterota bacterium]